MSAREAVLAKLRRALGAPEKDEARRDAVAARLNDPQPNLIPARGQLDRDARIALFCNMAEKVAATVRRVDRAEDVPILVAAYLRWHNLPLQIRTGTDPVLAGLPWEKERTLERFVGPSDGHDAAALSRATAGVAETGTLVLLSGADNPTTLNLLPDTHIVLISADDIVGDYETVWRRLSETYGAGNMPRTVNLVTGPSRSADIEQTLILGAHGPRALHILVVG